MKILIVTPFFPYAHVPHAGGKFVYEILKKLSQKHEVHLLSRVEPEEIKFVDDTGRFCKHIYLNRVRSPDKRSLFSLLWIGFSYLLLGHRANQILREGEFDLVQVEFVETGLLIKPKRTNPMILDAHDVLAKPWRRRYLTARGFQKATNFLFWKLLERLERFIYRKFDIIFTRSEHDRAEVMRLGIRNPVEVIPHPAGSGFQIEMVDNKREHCSLLFLGSMNRDANILAVLHFYRNILPHIREDIPEVRFYIVGNDPPDEIRGLARNDASVNVTGYVDCVELYYLKATVFVSPILIGGGIIAKNLDAMACGCPVVTTSLGNEGIGATPGKEILVADDPQEFARNVVSLLKDENLRAEIGNNGQQLVRRQFSLESIMDKMESHYAQLLEGSGQESSSSTQPAL